MLTHESNKFRASENSRVFSCFFQGAREARPNTPRRTRKLFSLAQRGLLAGRTTFFPLLAFEFGWHFENGWLSVGLGKKSRARNGGLEKGYPRRLARPALVQ